MVVATVGLIDPVHQGRPGPRAGRHLGGSGPMRCPSCRRSAETLPGYEATSWSGLMAPKGTPARDRRQAQPRGQREPRRSQDHRALHRHRRTADAGHARCVRPHHRGRHRKMGEGGQGDRRQGELSRGDGRFGRIERRQRLRLNTAIFSTDVPSESGFARRFESRRRGRHARLRRSHLLHFNANVALCLMVCDRSSVPPRFAVLSVLGWPAVRRPLRTR